MAKYEIKKVVEPNGDKYYKLYLDGIFQLLYLVSETYNGTNLNVGKEENALPYLKLLIESHKKTGTFDNTETVYSED